MKAYIQTDENGNYYNVNTYLAHEGFLHLGWDTQHFSSLEEITENDPEYLIAGGIGIVRKRLKQLGISPPETEIDYPKELEKYLGRRVRESTVEKTFEEKGNWNIFIKPKNETKKFVGKIIREEKDFIGILDKSNPTEIWCAEIVNFKTEWRCFIRYGEILDIRQYKGAWDSKLDLSVVKNAVADYKSSPNAYGLDFGVDENNVMKLVEVNDGHSLGTYGISAVKYAKFLAARWAELTNTTDYARF